MSTCWFKLRNDTMWHILFWLQILVLVSAVVAIALFPYCAKENDSTAEEIISKFHIEEEWAGSESSGSEDDIADSSGAAEEQASRNNHISHRDYYSLGVGDAAEWNNDLTTSASPNVNSVMWDQKVVSEHKLTSQQLQGDEGVNVHNISNNDLLRALRDPITAGRFVSANKGASFSASQKKLMVGIFYPMISVPIATLVYLLIFFICFIFSRPHTVCFTSPYPILSLHYPHILVLHICSTNAVWSLWAASSTTGTAPETILDDWHVSHSSFHFIL